MTDDRTPQMRAVSTNRCPNARRRGLTEFSTCDLDAMTAWGYCTECWQQGRVPARWAEQVDAAILRQVRP